MSLQGQNVVRDWFRDNVHLNLKHRGIDINLELVSVENEIKKPGPVFIEIARKAYDLGAEFMYRVNDDTEFHGRWPKLYSHTLLSLSKPYGVVGPRSTTTQNRILTHDFVHRTHMDIFDKVYYPVELVDWWMDDWISSIYGISRTFMSKDVTVIHHVKYHGRRYEVNENNKDKLEPLVARAKRQILLWMNISAHRVNKSHIENFEYESEAMFKHKLRYVNNSGSFEEYYQIGGKRGMKKAPNKADAGRFQSFPIAKCDNASSVPNIPSSLMLHQEPLIAILVATTTRTEPFPSTKTLSLFTLMIPSLIRSLDCGFKYVIVLGYDIGDRFFDNIGGQSAVMTWFKKEILPTVGRGVKVELDLVKVKNDIKKPGPVFYEIARRSYDIGADFMYRVNDDTEFHGRWPKLYVETLMNMSKPYGVIGPRCTTTHNRILTHDFVHRTHMDIFNKKYYPLELVDWWMDDWMSLIYGINRTFMSRDVTVIHHVKYHGRRYEVNMSNQALLTPLKWQSRSRILDWMKEPSHKVDAQSITEYFHLTHPVPSESDNEDLLQFKLCDGSVEKYHEVSTPVVKPKPKPKGKSKSRKTKSTKFSKPTTFHLLPMPDCRDYIKQRAARSPLIAILTGSTSRSENNPSNTTLSIFTIMLPSLMRSLDCGFGYVVVVGYDKGDKFYDSAKVWL